MVKNPFILTHGCMVTDGVKRFLSVCCGASIRVCVCGGFFDDVREASHVMRGIKERSGVYIAISSFLLYSSSYGTTRKRFHLVVKGTEKRPSFPLIYWLSLSWLTKERKLPPFLSDSRFVAKMAMKCGGLPQCCICLDAKDGGIHCASSDFQHFTCIECLSIYVNAKCNFDHSDGAAASWKARKGNILCPMASDCSSASCTHLTCTSEPFSTQQLARLLPESSFDSYMQAKEKYVGAVAFDKLVNDYGGVVKDSNQLLVDQIKRTNPDARQCPQCEYGPLTQSYCTDLMAHQGQVVGVKADGSEITISNNCPECGFLGPIWSAYPIW